ncbi:hypothetical protein [Streptomyces uncialis]|uniref:H-type lectin domain-containing protein n=1 Tax=Streptomyces uncialis TaxID=1048205 RepID=A0A1Q4VEL2_9ACTN|nr:hypothetical protein [Streptomyces uncialis]MCX4660446.1 hypothetical protein [Streptomyces uncialis]OKH96230.1 hypothetical protein AB852_06225 [Streptomyces uncialis]WTE12913.1 hypothetical protein OG924_23310 [Streptomyces uncialis]
MSAIQTGKLQLNSTRPVATTGGDTSTFTQVTFPAPFPAGSTVIVTPFVQTFNGPDTPGLRIADVTPTGFKIRINELHASGKVTADGTHTEETVGWIAATV